MAFGFSGGSAENIRPRPPLREDFAIIREEPNLRLAFAGDPEEEYEVERLDAQGNATVVGSSSSPDILVPSQAREHRVVAKNKELGIRGTPSVPKRELKPEHRWQMPQPRNLLSDPEALDPNNSAWSTGGTYNGKVANVGPDGQSAFSFSWSSDFTSIFKQVIGSIGGGFLTSAFYVRAKSGTEDIRISGFDDDDGTVGSSTKTVNTNWQWVEWTHEWSDFRNIRLESANGNNSGTLYILRAGLNRGSSLEYSTRSQVPQEIPDVVQGADLSNGSTTGADTNDLDFAVDSGGVPYAVSDGDDQASGTVLKGNGTIAISYYVSSSSSVDKGVILEGNANNFQIAPRRDRNGFRIVVKNPQGNDVLLRSGGLGSSTQDAWQQAIITRVNDTDLRFNFNGTELSYSFNQKYDDSDLKISVADGRRVRQVETHPVLTEAEAEAVRQRLATNPPDPVPVTEAWDFTAETNPHNLIPDSEDFTVWDSGFTYTTGLSNPLGGTDAVEIEDTNDSNILASNSPVGASPGSIYTQGVWVKKKSNAPIVEFALADGASNPTIHFDPDTGDVQDVFNSDRVIDKQVIDYDPNWWLVFLVGEVASDGNQAAIKIFPAISDTIGNRDGSFTGSNTFFGAHLLRGQDIKPPYIPTNGSIAYPQTVPSLRGSNDLTLGSTSGADTNDPDWVAPVGVVTDGDDRLDVPPETLTQEATWTHAFRQIGSKLQFRVGPVQLKDKFNINIAIQDVKGSLYTLSSSGVIFDDNKHVYTLVYSEAKRIVRLYLDGNIVFDVDLDADTSLDALNPDAYTNFLDNSGGNAVHENLIHYSRVLTAEEIAYDAERLLDNPETAFPNYTTP